ncbi:deoxyribonuclease IV [Paenibacillus sp. IB182496]|uniref:Deoxyribonuclease IV n=1 Tax=Paenibacillus sabuli TaxID=2772509 RepID=A0A927GTL7_9BACL|nr:deoxyribonuclease IV [Paenibacillus sabuli]MBD2847964.1 deoxyribonuclease IV [Paenibacillus sabuli]
MKIGCHVSTVKGYLGAAQRAAALGGTAFQYFPKNPRGLAIKRYDRADAARCAAYCRERGIVSIGHSPYPANLAAQDEEQIVRTAASLRNDLEIVEACGSLGTVVHFGVYKGDDLLAGYRSIIRMLDLVLEGWDGKARLLVENQAGDHARMGTTFEELAQIRQLARYPDQIGYCLDTCHLFASGVWDGSPGGEWLRRARDSGVLTELSAVHFNDSIFESGARRDRHAALGEGQIGAEGLRAILAVPEIAAAPLVLETPQPGVHTHAAQLNRLQGWLAGDS